MQAFLTEKDVASFQTQQNKNQFLVWQLEGITYDWNDTNTGLSKNITVDLSERVMQNRTNLWLHVIV